MDTIQNSDFTIIQQFELFRGIERRILEQAMSGSRSRLLKHREFVFRSGELAQSFFIVMEGAVKLLRHSPKGDDVIMHFAVQGDVIGALLMNQTQLVEYPISAKSMGPSRVMAIAKSTFREFWQSNLELQRRLNALLYRRMSNIQDDKLMAASPLRIRIANLLIRHIDQDSHEQSQVLSLNLTRQEIADSLGVAVESVIRVMRDWIDNGTIARPLERGPEAINVPRLLQQLEP